MLKQSVTYTDFNDEKRTDILYFHLSAPEIMRLNVEFDGGLEHFVENLDPEERPDEVLKLFETVLKASYGVKTEDGRSFVKEPNDVELFYQSGAYAQLFVELVTDADKAAGFFNALVSSSNLPTAISPN